MMATRGSQKSCLWNGTLALLLMALASGIPCKHLWTLDNTFPWDALRLLHDMAPNSTQPCQLHSPPSFPDTLLRTHLHPHQAAAAALRILQHLFHTLGTNATSQLWHSQPRHRLLNQLQHSIHRLEQCHPGHVRLFTGPRNLLLTINKYFRDIHLFLRAHNHTACAWDHVRLQARACILHVHRLTWQMKHRAALDSTEPTHSDVPAPPSTGSRRWSGGSGGSSRGRDRSAPLLPLPATTLS